MKQTRDFSIEKRIERLKKQIRKFGDSTGRKTEIIKELREEKKDEHL